MLHLLHLSHSQFSNQLSCTLSNRKKKISKLTLKLSIVKGSFLSFPLLLRFHPQSLPIFLFFLRFCDPSFSCSLSSLSPVSALVSYYYFYYYYFYYLFFTGSISSPFLATSMIQVYVCYVSFIYCMFSMICNIHILTSSSSHATT